MKPDIYYPAGRPVVRLLVNGLLELLLSRVVGRYRDIPGIYMYFAIGIEDKADPETVQLYQQREAAIERMRSQRVRDWIRKVVWPEEYPAPDFDFVRDLPIEGMPSPEPDDEEDQ